MNRRILALVVVAATRVALAAPAPDAAALFHQGQAAYDQQRYDDALAAWEQSYTLSHVPALLYNIAQAYRLRGKPGDCATARADYQRFVELAEPSPQREIAERYIAELASCAARTSAEPPRPSTSVPAAFPPSSMLSPPVSSASAPPATDSPTASPDGVLRARTIATVGLGVAGIGLLAAGIAVGHHASTLGNDVTAACSVSCDWSAEKSKDAAGRRDAALGWTFGTLGIAALVGDVALYYFGIHEHHVAVAPPASRKPGAVLTWSHTW